MSANGFLRPDELASIGNGLSLRKDAAAAWLAALHDAAENYHQNIQSTAIASAYRWWAMQLDMRKHPLLYGINPNLHALPGLPSGHGDGDCRDVPFGAPNNWMIAHGAEHGWYRPAVTMALGDLNHWKFAPGTATAGLDSHTITATNSKDDDMPIAIKPNIIAWPNGYISSYTEQVYAALVAGYKLTELEPGWITDTIVREQWIATDFIANRTAQASAAATLAVLKSAGVTTSPSTLTAQQVADAVMKALPKPPTTFTITAQ